MQIFMKKFKKKLQKGRIDFNKTFTEYDPAIKKLSSYYDVWKVC